MGSATPGPWEAVLDGDLRGQPACYYRGLIALVERGNRTLAVVLGGGHAYDNVPESQWEPNAVLIAAAPDMLVELKVARRLLEFARVLADRDDSSVAEKAFRKGIQRLDRAIAKAEGRATEGT